MTDLPPGVEIDDPRINQAEAPYTYFLPHEAELEEVRPGDLIKAVFRETEGGRHYDAERMWVKVETREEDAIVGKLENKPYDLELLSSETSFEFRYLMLSQSSGPTVIDLRTAHQCAPTGIDALWMPAF